MLVHKKIKRVIVYIELYVDKNLLVYNPNAINETVELFQKMG